MKKLIIFLIICFELNSQIKIISENILDLPTDKSWSRPKYSFDGNTIFFTDENFNGIWKYILAEKSFSLITNDAGSGYQFKISDDNKFILYRKTTFRDKTRSQENIKLNLENYEKIIIESGTDLQIQNIIENQVVESKKINSKKYSKQIIEILGIEFGKIHLVKNGKTVIYDPITNGNYIWASLSPSKKYILFYETVRGTIIADLNGKIISELGRLDSPIWIDEDWILYMNEIDDGKNILSSDLKIISVKNKNTINLTNSKNIHELWPTINYNSKQISCSTLDGKIIIYKYE